jgi:hypothetical protein
MVILVPEFKKLMINANEVVGSSDDDNDNDGDVVKPGSIPWYMA